MIKLKNISSSEAKFTPGGIPIYQDYCFFKYPEMAITPCIV